MTNKELLVSINAKLDALETLIKSLDLTNINPDLVALDTRIEVLTGTLTAKVEQGAQS